MLLCEKIPESQDKGGLVMFSSNTMSWLHQVRALGGYTSLMIPKGLSIIFEDNAPLSTL